MQYIAVFRTIRQNNAVRGIQLLYENICISTPTLIPTPTSTKQAEIVYLTNTVPRGSEEIHDALCVSILSYSRISRRSNPSESQKKQRTREARKSTSIHSQTPRKDSSMPWSCDHILAFAEHPRTETQPVEKEVYKEQGTVAAKSTAPAHRA